MASKAERNPAEEEEEEGKIPVLTVVKNNAVLKNIFIVNKPPEEQHSRRGDHEDILLVGRHPDCDLMLTHPSISRFHLQIRSKPSSLTLSVLDLSSVHGTWVSGRRIEAGVSVEMKEGDTLRIGVSSRVYRLHWIPISRAYELDALVQQERRPQKLNSCRVETEEIQSVDSILECINSLFLDENVELTVKEKIPAAPRMLDDIVSLCCEEGRKSPSKDETFGVPSDPFGTETSYLPATSDGENKPCDSLNQVLSPPFVESVVECDNTLTENPSETECLPVAEAVLGTKMQQARSSYDTFTSPLPPCIQNSFEKHCSLLLINTDPASFDEKSAAEAVVPKESECGCTIRDNGRITDVSTAGAGIFNSENMFFPVEEVIPGTKFQQIKVVEEVAMDSLSDQEKQNMCDQKHSLNEIVQDIGNKSSASNCPISLQIESVNSSMPREDVLNITKENQALKPDMEILESSKDAMEKVSTICNIWSRRVKPTSAPQIRTSKSILKSIANVDNEVAMSNENGIMNKAISKDLFPVLDGEEEEIFTPDKENFRPNTLQLRFLKKKGKQDEIKHSKSQRSHSSKDCFTPGIYPDESISPSLSKRNEKDITNKTISKDLISVLDGEEEKEDEEIFTPDKENFSPDTLQLRLLKKMGKLEEIKRSKSQWSQTFGPNLDESISPTSNKENQTPKGAPDQKLQRKPLGSQIKLLQEQDVMALKYRVERVPFKSLKSTGGKGRSGTSCPVSAAKSVDGSKCGKILDMHINPSKDISGVQKRSWDMVVDTTSLTNKESRKALQLLQGLKGTRLIIPRLVIRELQSIKQQFTIFRRISEASLALEWIEECMVKTDWWIHIQSSVEEGGLIAPTPPASPQTQLGEESWTFLGGTGISQPLSCHKCSMEITSPTIGDHILDFAFLHKRKQNDGQLVLISEDVTLKIKCMAEGLLCEPAQEFRESLVNPFSGRFLWTKSSPRGQTWSCQDDVVLREKYCRLPLKKSSKGVASGLKLILLHNSQYGH